MWLYVPFTHSTSAPAIPVSDWPSLSPALVYSSRHCTVSGKQPAPKSLRLALKRGRFQRLRSGLTSEQSVMRLRANTFANAAASMESDFSLLVIPASHFPKLVDVVEKTILDTFGLGSLTPLIATARPCASSRMSQATLFSDSPKSEEISKTEDIAWRRVYSRRKRLALRISGSGCSFLPWMTPFGMAGIDATGKTSQGGEFAKQATQWATPQAERITFRTDTPTNMNGGNRTLGNDIASWATPRASMADRGGDSGSAQRQEQGPNPGLKDQANQWATPSARDQKSDSSQMSGTELYGTKGRPLSRQAAIDSQIGLPVETTPTPGPTSSHTFPVLPRLLQRRKLNPSFVEWLMGLPVGWTDSLSDSGMTACGPAAMELYLSARRRRLSSYLQAFS